MVRDFAIEFLWFGLKQAWACLFGGLLLALIIATRLYYPPHAWIARYDALVVAACAIQAGLLFFRLETLEEARVILIFHIIGTAMEVFKTSVGSWAYPASGVLHIGHVPLFSGFMYAAVGSYIARVWRAFDFKFTRHPPLPALLALSVAIYGNFFLDHWGFDARGVLLLAAIALLGRTTVYFRIRTVHRRLPLALGFVLDALFIWFGENIGTLTGTWLYPQQRHGWTLVPMAKLTSWFLLMIVSYTLVATEMMRQPTTTDPPG